MSLNDPNLCPEDRMAFLVQNLTAGQGMEMVNQALLAFPDDPRLHFLRGSLLAGERRHAEAREAIGRAVALDSGYEIARFQLGLLEFTSGDPSAAALTWGPLHGLADSHSLRIFVTGLMRLADDDVNGAVVLLRRGIAGVPRNEALNRDMQLLIDELLNNAPPNEDEPVSETQLLLRQLGPGTRR